MRTLGLDLGGSAVKWVVVDPDHGGDDAVLDRGRVPTPDTGPDDVVRAMASIVDERDDVEHVGLGVPGLFDAGGRTTLVPNVPGDWAGFGVVDRLADATGHRVALVNDARAFTLAELRLGAAVGHETAVAVTLGTGVGGGVAVGGRLHAGPDGRAGEVGHQVVEPHGRLCGCGARGCVETLASGPAIVAGGARAVLQGLPTVLRDRCDGDVSRLTVPDVVAAADDGDRHAVDVVDRAGAALGAGLANVCTVLRPTVVVIGGGVSAALDSLRPSLEATLRQRAPLADPLPAVVPAALGTHAGAIGAALWSAESAAATGDHDSPPRRPGGRP